MDATTDVTSLKVSELKAQLSAKGLDTTGVKSTLQQRLREALKAAPASASAPVEGEAKAEEPEDEIDESTRYTGTVFKFIKRRGFGRIIPEGKTEEDKDDMVFVHWKQIQSNDPWPALSDGQKVEYYLGKRANPKDPKKAVFAAQVTLEGGAQVTATDDRDFPNRSERFAGIVGFFNARKGFGFIKPKADFNFDETDFKADAKASIYVCREDIKSADDVTTMPSLKNDFEVEFALYKTKNKEGETRYAAGDVTLPGGAPLAQTDFREKQPRGQKRPRSQKGKKGKNKKGKKGGKNQKKGPQGAFKMNGMTFIPMQQQRAQPQIVMMNGQPYMVMPQQQQFGGMQQMMMGGMQNLVGFGQQPRKKRRKNKKKGKKKNNNQNNAMKANQSGNW